MGRVGSSPEFHVNFGLGRVGSLHLWVELGRVKKIGPTSNFAADPSAEIFWFQNSNTKYIVRIIINTASRSTMVSEVPLLSTKQNIVSPPVLSAVVIEARRQNLLFTVIVCCADDAKVEQRRASFISQFL